MIKRIPEIDYQRNEIVKPNTPLVSVDELIAFESGEMEDESTIINLFQRLVDNGMAWKLQGSYGRLAHRLINDGRVKQNG